MVRTAASPSPPSRGRASSAGGCKAGCVTATSTTPPYRCRRAGSPQPPPTTSMRPRRLAGAPTPPCGAGPGPSPGKPAATSVRRPARTRSSSSTSRPISPSAGSPAAAPWSPGPTSREPGVPGLGWSRPAGASTAGGPWTATAPRPWSRPAPRPSNRPRPIATARFPPAVSGSSETSATASISAAPPIPASGRRP